MVQLNHVTLETGDKTLLLPSIYWFYKNLSWSRGNHFLLLSYKTSK
jgi:hypothetical protein